MEYMEEMIDRQIEAAQLDKIQQEDELFTRKIILVSKAFEVFPDLQTAEKWLTQEGVQDKLKTNEGFKVLMDKLKFEEEWLELERS
jgi:hypothetical protein